MTAAAAEARACLRRRIRALRHDLPREERAAAARAARWLAEAGTGAQR